MFANFCLVRVDGNLPLRFHVDAFLPVEMPDALMDATTMKVALQLDPTLYKAESQAIWAMGLRARFNACLGDGVLLFKTEDPLTPEELEAYLKTLPANELERTIRESRVYRG